MLDLRVSDLRQAPGHSAPCHRIRPDPPAAPMPPAGPRQLNPKPPSRDAVVTRRQTRTRTKRWARAHWAAVGLASGRAEANSTGRCAAGRESPRRCRPAHPSLCCYTHGLTRSIYLFIYLSIYLSIDLHTYIQSYIHRHIYTYIHTHAYMYKYIHIYIYIYIDI